jgi:hypothetical protein
MASAVDICNTSLSNIGHKADVVSISPPDGGAHAASCARFYPIARDHVLEAYPWSFAIKRWTMTEPTGVEPPSEWEYAYTIPSDMLRPLSILPEEYGDEYKERDNYEIEGDYLYTNTENAILKYIARVTDTTKYTPSAVDAIGWKLSELLAGATVKGDASLRNYCGKRYEQAMMQAMALNANSARKKAGHTPIWISDR